MIRFEYPSQRQADGRGTDQHRIFAGCSHLLDQRRNRIQDAAHQVGAQQQTRSALARMQTGL